MEVAGASVSMAADVGGKVSTGDDVLGTCEHAESIMNSRIVPMIFFIILNDL
jgi:hypothetical protein